MSDDRKDNHQYEFIKEQVIEKKWRKYKRFAISLVSRLILAVVFGVVAAATFCIAEPKLQEIINKDSKKTPITFPEDEEGSMDPTEDSGVPKNESTNDTSNSDSNISNVEDNTEPVIVEKTIKADIEDFDNMYTELRRVAYGVNKSIVKISSIVNDKDWFGNPIEKKVSTTGLVVGNNNVDLLILVSLDRVEKASSIKIEFTNMDTVDAELQDYEKDINLAVISVKLDDIPEITQNSIEVATLGESYTVSVGYPVIALGNPNGYAQSMMHGMITSKGSSVSLIDNRIDLFNTDIIDNDYSDGVIINTKGEVIGIITRTLKENSNKELNTNIGISKIKQIIQRMVNQTPRVYFGIKAEDMTETAKKNYDILSGIYVNEAMANSPAFESGIKTGDIILQINEQSVTNTSNFYRLISKSQPEEKIKVKIKRTTVNPAKELELTVQLIEKER